MDEQEPRDGSLTAAEEDRTTELANADDLFYWMEETEADIPLLALGLDFPAGCRFCI
ncbi:MAG: hypothetical protein V1748_10770 [Actinomycetota bacterium]